MEEGRITHPPIMGIETNKKMGMQMLGDPMTQLICKHMNNIRILRDGTLPQEHFQDPVRT